MIFVFVVLFVVLILIDFFVNALKIAKDDTWARMRTDSLLKSPFQVNGIAFVLCSSYANKIFSRCLSKIKIRILFRLK